MGRRLVIVALHSKPEPIDLGAMLRPVLAEKPSAAEYPETARIRSALLAGVSAETPEGRGRVLLADLIDWHWREDKPAW